MATVFARLKLPEHGPPAPPSSSTSTSSLHASPASQQRAPGVVRLVDQGVHAFLVPLRDSTGKLMPGVEIRDCGYKVGVYVCV
jgi:hypothetical protein